MLIYLYIKKHATTGLKYFGKTESKNPFIYQGSGNCWKNHIKAHGKHNVLTIEVWGFDDRNLCREFALNFSEQNNIVHSPEWANQIPEDGNMGMPKNGTHSNYTKNKIGLAIKENHKSRKYDYKHLSLPKTKEHKNNLSLSQTKRYKENGPHKGKGKPLIRRTDPKDTYNKFMNSLESTKIMCEHCNKDCYKNIFTRFHGENCKFILSRL